MYHDMDLPRNQGDKCIQTNRVGLYIQRQSHKYFDFQYIRQHQRNYRRIVFDILLDRHSNSHRQQL